MALVDIREGLLPVFVYNSLHLCSPDQEIEKRGDLLVFKDGLSTDLTRVNGQCTELAQRVHQLIRMKYPRAFANLTIKEGNEKTFFVLSGVNHHFDVAETHDGVIWFIDPALGKVENDGADCYLIKNSVDERPPRTSNLSMAMANANILFKHENQAVYVGWVYEEPVWMIQKARRRRVPLEFDERTISVEGLTPDLLEKMRTLHLKMKKALR